jgi:cysteine desulfurase
VVTIYLDHAAATPLRPEALEAMLPYLTSEFGNPSSAHAVGRRARMALDEAHERLARVVAGEPREIVFTSGATEAINLAIKGAAWAGKAMGHRIVTSGVEHRAVLEACRHLERFGFEVATLPVDRYGRLDPDVLVAALTERTILVSLQLANSEVGTVVSARELVRRVRAASGALIHVDAVQAAPWLALDVAELGADLVSLAGHKLGGPKGIGALWIRRGTAILPQVHGGSQERYRRAGTEHVAGAVGMAVAAELASREMPLVVPRLRALRDRLRDALVALPGVEVTGHPTERLPTHCSVIVRDLDGDDLVTALDLEGLACSTGSACTSGSNEPSHVLTAMGFPPEEARGALRLTLGRTTQDADVEASIGLLTETIRRLRDGGERRPAPGRATPETGARAEGSAV